MQYQEENQTSNKEMEDCTMEEFAVSQKRDTKRPAEEMGVMEEEEEDLAPVLKKAMLQRPPTSHGTRSKSQACTKAKAAKQRFVVSIKDHREVVRFVLFYFIFQL